MSLNKLLLWSVGIVTAIAGIRNVEAVHRSILIAQARLVYESRTEKWGTPRLRTLESKSILRSNRN